MYVSDYVIFGKNKDCDYVLIHSYIGNVDILEKEYGDILIESREENKEVDRSRIPEEIYNQLISKYYIVDSKTTDKQRYFKIANKIKQISSNKNVSYTLIPSYECNFRCSYCFEREVVGKCTNNKKMSRELVDAIFRDIDKKNDEDKSIVITLFGGEPLLESNKEINDYILQNAKDREIKVSAISNGYELDCYIDEFKKGYFSSIQITLDGSEAIHNSRRYRIGRKPTFRKIIENIEKILKIEVGPKISVRINIDKHNFNDVNNLYKLFNDKGWLKNNKFNFYTKSVHACYAKTSERVYDTDVIDNVKLFKDNIKNMKCNIQYRRMISDVKCILSAEKKMTALRTSACGATNGMLVIDAYGDVYACYEEVDCKENRIGYVDLDKEEIIYNDKQEKWLNRHVQNLDECSKCSYSLVCGGNCPEHTKVEKGSLYETCCEDKKEIFDRVLLELAPCMNEE